MNNLIPVDKREHLRGIVSLVHCRVHDCIMCLMVFMIIIDYCYQENFTLDTKMGCLFSRNELKIRIFDLTPAGDESEYLRPQGTITLTIDRKYNAPLMDIRFDGWYENSVSLWPKHSEQREHFLLLERTPLLTPSITSSSDSGTDTVF